MDVLTELEHLRRLHLVGTTPAPMFFQLKHVFHMLESLGSARIEGNHTMKTGITIAYDNPSTIGADRIVDAAAAKAYYSLPACIVDFGTATTFDAVSRDAEYLGGAIAPGINIGAEALFERTAQLPKINLAIPPSVIGKNTVHAMQSGLIFGYVGLVEGMIERFKKELGEDTTVIATGGLASMIAELIPSINHVDPWLTLDGIRLIWEMNQTHD